MKVEHTLFSPALPARWRGADRAAVSCPNICAPAGAQATKLLGATQAPHTPSTSGSRPQQHLATAQATEDTVSRPATVLRRPVKAGRSPFGLLKEVNRLLDFE